MKMGIEILIWKEAPLVMKRLVIAEPGNTKWEFVATVPKRYADRFAGSRFSSNFVKPFGTIICRNLDKENKIYFLGDIKHGGK